MGWVFRKSINIGPFRINFSKSGLSFSVGAAGLRAGINSRGRKYTSATVPGSGWRYQKTFKKKST